MRWNPTDAYLRVMEELHNQRLVEGLEGFPIQHSRSNITYRDTLKRLKVGHETLDSYINRGGSIYTVAHLPNSQENNGMVIFGIEYHRISFGNQSPFIVVQYESGNREPLMIAYFDLDADLVKNVAVSESSEESLKSLPIEGKGLEEGVQILFAGIKNSNVA